MSYKLVLSVQSFLKWKGINPGPLDGLEGPLTSAAWNKFLDQEEDAAEAKKSTPKPVVEVKPDPPTPVKPDPQVPQPATPSSDRFENFIMFVLQRECAYAPHSKERIPEDVVTENVPGDYGGPTKFGIDQASHPSVRVPSLTLGQAKEIYLQDWNAHKCNLLPTPLGEIVFDSFVTGGKPIMWLQQALNAVGDNCKLKVDGGIGPMTLAAVETAPSKKAVGNKMLEYRDEYFKSLGEKYSHDERFITGWLNRDKELLTWIVNNLVTTA